jgi:hypothetical protein
MKIMSTLAASAVVLVAVVGSAGAAFASPGPGTASTKAGTVRYEVDNGVTWTLSNKPLTSKISPASTYADAGIVVSLGETGSQYYGVKSAGYGPLATNLWIADGYEATHPGTHPLSAAVDFAYGAVQPNGSVEMFSGTYAGTTLTAADIRADFPKAELWAWSGIDIGAPVAPATRSSMTAATTAVYTFQYVKVHHSLRLRMVDVLKRGALYPESVKITTGKHSATTASVK